jgi:GT2 family glycosyltransferase
MSEVATSWSPKVSIVLVNHNTTELLLECLHSIHAHFSVAAYEVIVVDNASTGWEPSRITGVFPESTVLGSQGNVGFGRATNLGAQYATGTYLWLLNPDTLVPPDHNLAEVLRFLDEHEEYAAASPLLVNLDGRPQPGQRAYFPDLLRLLADKPARMLGRLCPPIRGLSVLFDYNGHCLDEADVPVMVAASLFVRRSAFLRVDGFSPEYFMFYEDTDLCRKLADAGLRVRFMPQSRVVHLWGRSIDSQRERKRLYYASQDIYLRKWFSPAVATAARVLRLPLALVYSRSRRG